jgi:hypothetical protein
MSLLSNLKLLKMATGKLAKKMQQLEVKKLYIILEVEKEEFCNPEVIAEYQNETKKNITEYLKTL